MKLKGAPLPSQDNRDRIGARALETALVLCAALQRRSVLVDAAGAEGVSVCAPRGPETTTTSV